MSPLVTLCPHSDCSPSPDSSSFSPFVFSLLPCHILPFLLRCPLSQFTGTPSCLRPLCFSLSSVPALGSPNSLSANHSLLCSVWPFAAFSFTTQGHLSFLLPTFSSLQHFPLHCFPIFFHLFYFPQLLSYCRFTCPSHNPPFAISLWTPRCYFLSLTCLFLSHSVFLVIPLTHPHPATFSGPHFAVTASTVTVGERYAICTYDILSFSSPKFDMSEKCALPRAGSLKWEEGVSSAGEVRKVCTTLG